MRRRWKTSCCLRRTTLRRPRAGSRRTDGATMARVDVLMPQMGESIAEGTLSKWLKKVGDTVKRDEPLFEISTDKVDRTETCGSYSCGAHSTSPDSEAQRRRRWWC